MILAIFDLLVTSMLPIELQVNWPFGSGETKYRFSRWPPYGPSVQEKQKIDFQDGGHLPIGTIFIIFDLQNTLMLPTKFQVNWPFGSGEEVKNTMEAILDSDQKDFS